MGSYRRTTPLKTTSATGDSKGELVVRMTKIAAFPVGAPPPAEWLAAYDCALEHALAVGPHDMVNRAVPRRANHHYENYSHRAGNQSTFYLY